MQLLTNSIITDKQKLTMTATIPIIVDIRNDEEQFTSSQSPTYGTKIDVFLS
jgi:hypothetical protein